jgi:hypothetical protein
VLLTLARVEGRVGEIKKEIKMIHSSEASMNNGNHQALFIVKAPSEEEWRGCWYRNYVGHVITGWSFSPQFSKDDIEGSEEEDKGWKKDAFHFFHCGFKTIHLSDVILLTHNQLQDYTDKMRHGNKLNLGERENSWLTWDSYLRKQYSERFLVAV